MNNSLQTILIVAFSAFSLSLIAQDSKITSGVIKEQSGEYYGAIQTLEEALSNPDKIKKEKNFARGHEALFLAYYGLYSEVNESGTKWYQNNPVGSKNSDLLMKSLENYQLLLASAEAEKYINSIPKFKLDGLFNSLYNEGVIAYNDRDNSSARTLFEAALVLKPKYILCHRLLASIARDQNDKPSCAEHYRAAIEQFEKESLNPDPESGNDLDYVTNQMTLAYCDYSLLLNEMGNTDEALSVIQRGQQLFPGNSDIDIYEMTIWQHLPSRIDESMPLYEQFILDHPENLQVKLSYASLLNSAGKLDQSFKMYQQVYQEDPENYHANFGLGAHHINVAADLNSRLLDGSLEESADVVNEQILSEMEQAYPYMKKLHELDPQDKEWLAQLINICSYTGRDDEAMEYVKKRNALD